MNWLDLAITGVIAWSTFSAFRAGLIRVSVSLASVVAGALLAGRFYGRLADNIDFLVAEPQLRRLIAFMAIFVGLIVLGQVLGALLKSVSALLFLGPLDHLGGAVFGFVQGVLVVELLLFLFTAFPVIGGLPHTLDGSTLAPVFIERIPIFELLLPKEVRDAVDAVRGLGSFQGLLPGGPIPSVLLPGPAGTSTTAPVTP
jgi:membrane protein required for colicin V production